MAQARQRAAVRGHDLPSEGRAGICSTFSFAIVGHDLNSHDLGSLDSAAAQFRQGQPLRVALERVKCGFGGELEHLDLGRVALDCPDSDQKAGVVIAKQLKYLILVPDQPLSLAGCGPQHHAKGYGHRARLRPWMSPLRSRDEGGGRTEVIVGCRGGLAIGARLRGCGSGADGCVRDLERVRAVQHFGGAVRDLAPPGRRERRVLSRSVPRPSSASRGVGL